MEPTEVIEQFKALVREMRAAGITDKQILAKIRKHYPKRYKRFLPELKRHLRAADGTSWGQGKSSDGAS